MHAIPVAGHAGYDKTIHRTKKDFFFFFFFLPRLKSDVKKFIQECDACQRVKVENMSPAGLLQPFQILERP
jgi:hypothetical protein